MTAMAAELTEVRQATSSTENKAGNARDLVNRYRAGKIAIILTVIVWWAVARVQKPLSDLKRIMGHLPSDTDADRALLSECAAGLARSVKLFEEVQQKYESAARPIVRIPGGQKLFEAVGTRLEETICTTEAIAEAFVLATSEEFLQLVKSKVSYYQCETWKETKAFKRVC